MVIMVSFVVIGPPQPKERARMGAGGRWFTPERTRFYERAVKHRAQLAVPKSWPLDARYVLTVRMHFADARRRDADNVIKAVSDALNGVCFADDSQVVETHAFKHIDRDNPRTEVQIEVKL